MFDVTQESLADAFDYKDGCLYWKKSKQGISASRAAKNIKRFGLQQASEQAGIACGVKCSSRTKLARTSVRAKGSASVLNRSPEAHARAA